ncbi:superoxide dismutase [Candidatus Woesearchaeota archaeon]|nr:superoxide dismutase [Candidatus Woesearchaeota archaeon]
MYTTKDYSKILGTSGFSNKLLETHFGLYNGYVKNTNLLIEKLKSIESGTPEWAELKRRFGWEFNGMRLHELYFENITKEKKELKNLKLMEKLNEDFGSLEKCEEDFISCGKLRGIGWVIMVYDKKGDRIFNTWINEHDVGHLSGCVPLLVMDVFEHAFILDYGMDRASYIKSFIDAIDWDVVSSRF